jgi:diguanylate cyclase (GGDEF)-like protein
MILELTTVARMGLLRWMPKGSPVSDESWRARHRIVLLALWLSVPTLFLVGLLGPMPVTETLVLTAVTAGFAVAGSRLRSREAQAEVTSCGLILASFAGVDLSGGQVHAHLYILSAVALVALYQRWLPLLYTIAAVVIHHVGFGLIAPERVFNGDMAMMGVDHQHIPAHDVLLMVLVHTSAVAIEVFAILMFWRFSEQLSAQLQVSLDELKLREDQLRHQATHDVLTGLPNRAHFGEEVMTQLRSGGRFAVLMLDLDDFKPVNDTYGHHAGDLLLISVAQRLSDCLGGTDVAARLGGDEFAVLVRTIADRDQIQRIADRIIATMSDPFYLDDAKINVTVSMSIGIARTDEKVTLTDLMRRADSAMYSAKRAGKGQWVLHDESGELDASTSTPSRDLVV